MIDEGGTLTLVNGQYSLSMGMGFNVDFLSPGGFGPYRDLFEFKSTIGTSVLPPIVSIDHYTGSVPEDAGSITVTLARSGADLGLASTVLLSTEDGAASSSGVAKDFNAVTNREIVFAPGATSVTVTLDNVIIDDRIPEPNENFHIRISSPVNASLGSATGDITIVDNDIIGTSGADTLRGGAANDSISGGAGNDTLDGGAGINKAVYSGVHSHYAVARTATGYSVKDNAGTDGTDTLTHIERLQFSDTKLAIDMDVTQSGGEAALLIGAVLGKLSLTDKALVGQLIQFFDAGYNMHDAANALVTAGIMDRLAGGSSTSAYVNLIYHAVTGSVATPAITAQLAHYIDIDGYTKADFLAIIAVLPLNQANVDLVGLQQAGIEYG
jgi:hypothetical protein